VWWGLVAVVAAVSLGPAAVSAQESGDGASDGATKAPGAAAAESDTSATVESPVGDGDWYLDLSSTESRDDEHWQVTLQFEEDGPMVHEVIVPEWAKPPTYRLEAQVARLGDRDVLVLVDLVPGGEDPAANTEVTVQVALHGSYTGNSPERASTWAWQVVGRTQYSSLDGGNRLVLEESAGETRLVRTRPSSSSTFCGSQEGGDVLNYVFDPEAGQFVEQVDLERYSSGASTLEASLPDTPLAGPFTRGVYQWYWATSDLSTSSDVGEVVRPMALGDRRGDTAWRVDASRDVRGEFATANVSDSVPIRALHLVPGYTKNADAYRRNRLPKRLLFSFSDGKSLIVEVPEVDYQTLTERRGLVVELPEPVQTQCISVVHLESHEPNAPGDYNHATAISQVTPVTTVDARSAEQTASNIVDHIASEPDLRKRKRLAHMASGLSDELVEAVEVALEETDGQRRRRVIPLLGQLPSDRAVPLLIDFMVELDSDAVEYRAVKRSLAAHHGAAAEALWELLRELEPDNPKYVDVVRLLGRVADPHVLASLVEDFGRGDRFVRNERIRAAASGSDPVLSKLFAVAAVASDAPKTRDALKAIYLVGKRQNTPGLITHEQTDSLRQVIRKPTERRTLMLAFRAARYFRVDGFVETVGQRFVDHEDPLVRKAAMAALVRYSTPAARELLERGLDDDSPDVRIAAVGALAQRDDRAKSVEPLLNYVRRETWRPGLQQGLRVLAGLESPKVRAFFHEILDERRGSKLALLTANALDRSGRTIEVSLAREIAFDEDAPDRLRLEMIDLLGLDDTSEGESYLFSLLDPAELQKYVADSELRRRFERRALLSLGQRRSPRARGRMLKMAKTGSDRKLRQHAIRALAFYRGDDLVDQLEAWRPDAPPELRSTLDQTIQIIENRGAIDDVEDQVEATMEAEEEIEDKEKKSE
jgi:HEAT repeat protein